MTRSEAERQFDWFVTYALADFGTYQDALVKESPWVFHGLISMYINCGLLDPLAVCQRVEIAWREGDCSLSAAEGFIRQVLGWREYIRGIYWLLMPEYKSRNTLSATRPLPDFFWDANTDMRCLSRAIEQSLDHGYAHHIQRLMVIGNFALLAGLDVMEVCDWYLGVYVDAYEWVELPNTLGMALYGDNAVIAVNLTPPAVSTFRSRATTVSSAVTSHLRPPGPTPVPTIVSIGGLSTVIWIPSAAIREWV